MKTVLLHGLGRTKKSMNPMKKFLESIGFSDVFNIGYESTKNTIQGIARLLDHEIGVFVDEETNFVTHSMGGIVLRYWHKKINKKKIGRVVMLAPPNKGSEVIDVFGRTPWFKAFLGPAGNQLSTYSNLIRDLGMVDFECGVITGSVAINPINWLVLPKPNDGKVSVSAAKVEGMKDFLVVKVPHPVIMSDSLVMDQTYSFLANGRFYDQEAKKEKGILERGRS